MENPETDNPGNVKGWIIKFLSVIVRRNNTKTVENIENTPSVKALKGSAIILIIGRTITNPNTRSAASYKY